MRHAYDRHDWSAINMVPHVCINNLLMYKLLHHPFQFLSSQAKKQLQVIDEKALSVPHCLTP